MLFTRSDKEHTFTYNKLIDSIYIFCAKVWCWVLLGHPLFDPSSGTLGKGDVGLCGFEFGGWVWGAR